MHAPGLHGFDRSPNRVAAHACSEVLIDGDDHVRIPEQHLLDGDDGEAATPLARDVASAEIFDGLDVDRAAEAGLKPAWATCVVDARPARLRYSRNALADGRHGFAGIAGEFLRLGPPVRQFAELAIALRDRIEAPIEQRIGNAGLLLHARGQRNKGRIGRAGIQDQVGFEREYHFEIGSVAAAGDAPDLRARANLRQHVFALLWSVGARPPEQQVRSQRVQQDRGWRAGREHARDLVGDRNRASARVVDGCSPQDRGRSQRCGQPRKSGAAIEQHRRCSSRSRPSRR